MIQVRRPRRVDSGAMVRRTSQSKAAAMTASGVSSSSLAEARRRAW
jgi:hypothetical protein